MACACTSQNSEANLGDAGGGGTTADLGGSTAQRNAGGTSNAAGGAAAAGAATGGSGAAAGGSSSGGAAGARGVAGAKGTSEVSGMPIPAAAGIARPSGNPNSLMVLKWAGFKAAASFTFDDSLSSQISNYAALQATGVHLTFYLVSNNNGTSATWSQAAKDGHELGNHTADHCHDDGAGCFWGSYAGSLGAELDECTTHIKQQFGVSNVWTSASPYGDTGYETADSTRFLLNRGVQSGSVGANDNTNLYALPCHVAAQGELANAFNSVTDAARDAGKWQVFLIHSLGGDGGYNPISMTDALGAIEHAKSAGDIWIDSVVHVGAYWLAQKLLSGAVPTVSGSGKTWSWMLPSHFPPGRFLRVKVDGGTLSQHGMALPWSEHGYYEVALDAGAVTLTP